MKSRKLKIRKVPQPAITASHIQPANYNPRQISPQKLEALGKAMREFGDLGGIVVNVRTGHLVSGHQRLKHIAKEWLIEKAPASDQTGTVALGTIQTPWGKLGYREVDWDETKEKTANLAANQHRGEWDSEALGKLLQGMDTTERLLAGFTPEDIKALAIGMETKPSGDPTPQVDRAEELNAIWKVSPGDLWVIGEHRLLCGDSTRSADVECVLAGSRPWLMVTDPPYGVNYSPEWRKEAGVNNSDTMGKVTNDNRAQWAATYARSGCEVAYVWHAGVFSATVAMDLQASGFTIRSQIIWAKKRFAMSRGDYHWAHEPCWYAVKDGCPGRFTGDRKNTTLWADIMDGFSPKATPEMYACQIDKDTIYAFSASSSTVWTLKNDKQVDGGHSTQKPIECMARPMRNHGFDGDYVYDPFGGTGTTMAAAQTLNRKARLIEIAPQYCAVILQRMKDAFGIVGIRA